jgi:translocation and assembly module TamB
VPNGLSQLHGTLEFNQNRLEVKSLTAMSGGGLLSVGGYLAYQHGIYADLSVTGKGVRIRYPQGVSSLADATLRLQGSQNNLLLSGDVLITRFTVSPDFDIAALAAQANAVRPSRRLTRRPTTSARRAPAVVAAAELPERLRQAGRQRGPAPARHRRLALAAGPRLHHRRQRHHRRHALRPAARRHHFTNPVRIEPTIDLNATARVEDYDITLGLHGTPQKLPSPTAAIPPLPEADVVALLALGRTENQQRLYTQQQEQSVANPTTDALLGGALNATVSSRVQKLFGAGSVKVDPNYIGALGNSTSRITVEEQLGRNVTPSPTPPTSTHHRSSSLLQAESPSTAMSLLVARDESGVFSMVVKATRRYRLPFR